MNEGNFEYKYQVFHLGCGSRLTQQPSMEHRTSSGLHCTYEYDYMYEIPMNINISIL